MIIYKYDPNVVVESYTNVHLLFLDEHNQARD